jgi:hypothetical protein
VNVSLSDWPRPHHTAGGSSPFLYYVVFGSNVGGLRLSRSKYRSEGIPEGIELSAYGPTTRPDMLDEFRHGYLWEELVKNEPRLAKTVAAQERCVVVRGEVADERTLNYLRDIIGLRTCMLDSGGLAIFDPQSFKWWSPSAWKRRVFEPAEALPREHVVILVSEEQYGTQWLHTRGMRKFGRPDLSVHRVRPEHYEASIELLNRFIEFQALGGRVTDGQEIRMRSLPAGMRCVHGGDDEDPDFNNRHVEVVWPSDA